MKRWLQALGLAAALHLLLLALFVFAVREEPKELAPASTPAATTRVTRVSLTGSVASTKPEPSLPLPSRGRGSGRGEAPTVSASGVDDAAAVQVAKPGPELAIAAPNEAEQQDGATPDEGAPNVSGQNEGTQNAGAQNAGTQSAGTQKAGTPNEGTQNAGTPNGDALAALLHAKLSAAAEKCYPPAAKRFRQRGTVELSFCVDASAQASRIELAKPSGSPLLDAAATGCVLSNASPFPAESAGRCFALPVRFGQ